MHFPFIRKRKYWYILSLVLTVISLSSIFLWGFKPGIDFTGGSLLEIQFSAVAPNLEQLNKNVKELNLGNFSIQPSEDNVYILRQRDLTEDEHKLLLNSIIEYYQASNQGEVIQLRFESIGPSIGLELRNKAFATTIITLIFIILFIAYAFRKVSQPVASWKYGLAALVSLFHDIIILLGVFSILGKFFGYEINILFLTALLTTLGYSVNDTIVVFDRIRENIFSRHEDFPEAVEDSMNQTFARSINTSFTTLLVLFAVYFFGGDTIKEFVLALLVGIGIGTYSSIFLASPILVDWFKLSQNKKN
jgi:preprotein translocase subunit SecF